MPDRGGIAVQTVRRAELAVPVEAQPAEILLDGARELLGRALGVRVVEAEDELAARVPCVKPVDERGACVAEMKAPGWARREAENGSQRRNPFVIG
jgi:hypothetical protein